MTCSRQENRVRRTAQDLPPARKRQDAAGAATSGIQPPATYCFRLSCVHALIPQSTLVLAAVSGLAVLEALEKQGLASEIALKWPNDLVARGRKLGGILVEAARDNEGKPFAVCGIGVNVNYTPQEVPDGGLAAIGLSDLNESVPAVDMLLDEVYHAVIDAVDTWAERLNAMEENAGPLAPSTTNISLTSIGSGSTLSPAPPLETSWHEAYLERSTIAAAHALRPRAACASSTSKKHPCAP